jgi:hypothetical protein
MSAPGITCRTLRTLICPNRPGRAERGRRESQSAEKDNGAASCKFFVPIYPNNLPTVPKPSKGSRTPSLVFSNLPAICESTRTISGTPTAKAISEYLVLLSVCETCRNKRIDFLDLLRSGDKDIEAFAASKGRKQRNKHGR